MHRSYIACLLVKDEGVQRLRLFRHSSRDTRGDGVSNKSAALSTVTVADDLGRNIRVISSIRRDLLMTGLYPPRSRLRRELRFAGVF